MVSIVGRPAQNPPEVARQRGALQRLAERCEARSPDDLLDAMKELWAGYIGRVDRLGAEEASKAARLELPVRGGVAILERSPGRAGFTVVTVLSSEMAARDAASRAGRISEGQTDDHPAHP
jgi:hypothetical protein